jgi:hypothetical protein
LDEHLSDATGQTSAHSAFWLRFDRTVVDGRQRRRSCWRVAHPFLQKANMENIMELGARRKSESNGDVVDELDDAVGPKEARL